MRYNDYCQEAYIGWLRDPWRNYTLRLAPLVAHGSNLTCFVVLANISRHYPFGVK